MRQVQFKDFEALKGLHNAIRVRAATTANITVSTALNAGDTLDGVTLAAGDAVLVKDQSTASGNGIYIVAADPYRHPDFSSAERNNAAAYDTHAGLTVTVMEGTTNADTMWVCTSNKGGALGTDNIVFTQLEPLASDTVAGKIEIAIQSEMEAGSDATRAVTPGRQHYHPSAAKCWAVVSVSAGTPSLDASYNITSITDTGTGQLTITIGTDFSSSDWAAICTLLTGTDRFAQIASRAAGSVQIDVWDVSEAGVTGDPLGYSFAGFGDQ